MAFNKRFLSSKRRVPQTTEILEYLDSDSEDETSTQDITLIKSPYDPEITSALAEINSVGSSLFAPSAEQNIQLSNFIQNTDFVLKTARVVAQIQFGGNREDLLRAVRGGGAKNLLESLFAERSRVLSEPSDYLREFPRETHEGTKYAKEADQLFPKICNDLRIAAFFNMTDKTSSDSVVDPNLTNPTDLNARVIIQGIMSQSSNLNASPSTVSTEIPVQLAPNSLSAEAKAQAVTLINKQFDVEDDSRDSEDDVQIDPLSEDGTNDNKGNIPEMKVDSSHPVKIPSLLQRAKKQNPEKQNVYISSFKNALSVLAAIDIPTMLSPETGPQLAIIMEELRISPSQLAQYLSTKEALTQLEISSDRRNEAISSLSSTVAALTREVSDIKHHFLTHEKKTDPIVTDRYNMISNELRDLTNQVNQLATTLTLTVGKLSMTPFTSQVKDSTKSGSQSLDQEDEPVAAIKSDLQLKKKSHTNVTDDPFAAKLDAILNKRQIPTGSVQKQSALPSTTLPLKGILKPATIKTFMPEATTSNPQMMQIPSPLSHLKDVSSNATSIKRTLEHDPLLNECIEIGIPISVITGNVENVKRLNDVYIEALDEWLAATAEIPWDKIVRHYQEFIAEWRSQDKNMSSLTSVFLVINNPEQVATLIKLIRLIKKQY